MKIVIDTELKKISCETSSRTDTFDLYSEEAFDIVSNQWLKIGWNQKYSYSYTWFGLPMIQLPEDVLRTQEAVYSIKPDVVVETGIAHGGSLIFYASLLKAMGRGRVVGVDIDIRLHNREKIEKHEFFPYITLIEGDSAGEDIIARVQSNIKKGDTVMVVLDSCHLKGHVLKELEAYHKFVTVGSYIVATDGIMQDLHDVPRGEASWIEDNPVSAVEEFLKGHPEFILEKPARGFNESLCSKDLTYWPKAWLKRIR
ncbi:MAG: hydroxylase [Candidatus Wallbacteria bacterium GWC2_49_35]|uniref:Hydroxylase n=1 Tax=Candidatus Wallbacteria bacterium GWC2_49_35 TaxID=1817813 RepID=A0A1F7WSY2_9BACT|nr:MAG: hydroxylase [Candidatus Wallbacteria bacterium GWC2_49_35]HBC76075.1 hydroxylase [Candidatus Wallbacteria bacterium]